MATRVGPTLTLVASCEGCGHLRRERGFYVCGHEAMRNGPALCPASLSPRTPDVCPELPAARLALAREIVAGADAMREEAARRWDEAIEAAERAREAQRKESE